MIRMYVGPSTPPSSQGNSRTHGQMKMMVAMSIKPNIYWPSVP